MYQENMPNELIHGERIFLLSSLKQYIYVERRTGNEYLLIAKIAEG